MGEWVTYLSVRKLVWAMRTWVTEESMRREERVGGWVGGWATYLSVRKMGGWVGGWVGGLPVG